MLLSAFAAPFASRLADTLFADNHSESTSNADQDTEFAFLQVTAEVIRRSGQLTAQAASVVDSQSGTEPADTAGMLRTLTSFEDDGLCGWNSWFATDESGTSSFRLDTDHVFAGRSSCAWSYGLDPPNAQAEARLEMSRLIIDAIDSTGIIGVWVIGDGSSNSLVAEVRDIHGEVFQFVLGHFQSADWSWLGTNMRDNAPIASLGDGNGQLDKPIQVTALLIVSGGDTSTTGTIYVDEIQYAPD